MRKKIKKELKSKKQRNWLAVDAHFRKAGEHKNNKYNKRKWRADNRKPEEDE